MSGETQKLRSGAVRQAIVDTALTIALEDGLEALSVRKLSAAMGYTTGVIYYHFQDKEAILQEILRQQGAILQREIQVAAQGAETMEQRLRAVYHRVFLLAREKPPLYTLIARSFLEGRSGISAPFQALESQLQAHYGPRRDVDIHALAHGIWSSFIGFHISIARQPSLTDSEAEALFDGEIRLILHGLQGPSPRRRNSTDEQEATI